MSVADSFDCLSCGACCVSYRVSFYFGECDSHHSANPDDDSNDGAAVPTELVHAISPFRVCMQGTQLNPPRCVALNGNIGESVHCGIYAQRSSTCRNFEAGSEACIKARIKQGLVHQFEPIPAVVLG